MKFYTIDIDYIKYLNTYDSEVYINKKRHDYENKPYVGIVVSDDNMNYFVPLTSAQPKRLKLKNNGKDYMLIYDLIEKSEIHNQDIYTELENGKIKNEYKQLILENQYLSLKMYIMKLTFVIIKIEIY